jgi:putative ABC transport system ATP-binding protein
MQAVMTVSSHNGKQANMYEDYIALQQVTCRYGRGSRVNALAEVSLSVPQGQFVAVVGGAGSGKSALLRVLAGLLRPVAGTVVVGGMNLGAASEQALGRYRRRVVGFVPQQPTLLRGLTAWENVALPLLAGRDGGGDLKARAVEALEAVGAGELASVRAEALSQAQVAQVALARALVHDPELILADEPAGMLDVRGAARAMECLRERHQQGCTVIVASHHGADVDGAERCLRLEAGTVTADERLPS